MSRGAALDDSSWVGALTAIAFVLIIGKADRFSCGKQIASYLGLVPKEDSSGERRRLGHISKQATPCYVSCWWKLHRSRYAAMCDGATGFFTSGDVERSPKLPWRGDWRFVCTGCGAEDGITYN